MRTLRSAGCRGLLVAGALAVLHGTTPGPCRAAMGDCGQPLSGGDRPTATDAFFALRAAVGSSFCPLAVCDVDGSGGVSVSDALRILKAAVGGTGVTLLCPEPTTTTLAPTTTTTTTTSTSTSTTTSTTTTSSSTTTTSTTTSSTTSSTMGAVNQPPEADPSRLLRVFPDIAIDVDIDAIDPDDDVVTFASSDLPPGASLDAETGRLQWTPAAEDIGAHTVTVECTDDGRPPLSVETDVAIVVSGDDQCVVPSCDSATGCTTTPVAIDTDCCVATPMHPVVEPDVGCDQSAVLHVGRNSTGFGRMQNCDLLRIQSAGQGGVVTLLHMETRCLDASQRFTVKTQLKTATETLVNATTLTTFSDRGDGFAERRSLLFFVSTSSPSSLVGAEAELDVRVTDHTGTSLERTLRVVLTDTQPEDLP